MYLGLEAKSRGSLRLRAHACLRSENWHRHDTGKAEIDAMRAEPCRHASGH